MTRLPPPPKQIPARERRCAWRALPKEIELYMTNKGNSPPFTFRVEGHPCTFRSNQPFPSADAVRGAEWRTGIANKIVSHLYNCHHEHDGLNSHAHRERSSFGATLVNGHEPGETYPHEHGTIGAVWLYKAPKKEKKEVAK